MQATWVLKDGTRATHEVPEGTNLMQAAVARGIAGIVGECGGSLSCATCHVIVDPDWTNHAGPPEGFEHDMLDVTETERHPTSRLSCQLVMGPRLDGIIVQVP